MSTAKQDADAAKEAWDIVSEAAHDFSVAGGTQEERDEIAGALKFLRHRFRPGQVCVWHEDADGNWWTNCRHGWVFSEGGPYDNLMQYCCYCGRPLDEQAETHNPAIDGCAKAGRREDKEVSEQTRVKIEGQLYTPQQLADKLGVKLGKGVTAKLIASRLKNGKDVVWALTEPRMTSSQAARRGAKASGWRNFKI